MIGVVIPAHNEAVCIAALFAASDDSWGFRSRWYEARKRAITLACLPRQRYRCACEPGCAHGELAAALVPSCDALLASYRVAAAVALAQSRLALLDQHLAMPRLLRHEKA